MSLISPEPPTSCFALIREQVEKGKGSEGTHPICDTRNYPSVLILGIAGMRARSRLAVSDVLRRVANVCPLSYHSKHVQRE